MNRVQFLNRLCREEILQETWIEQLKKEALPLIMWRCSRCGI